MIRVFISLLISVLIPYVLILALPLYGVSYVLGCAFSALFYFLFCLALVRFANKEWGTDNHINCVLIILLCICMLLTGIMNLIMVNADIYYALKPWKSGDIGLTWKSIYFSIEMLVAFFVVTNGIDSLFFVDNCRITRFNGTIRANHNHY